MHSNVMKEQKIYGTLLLFVLTHYIEQHQCWDVPSQQCQHKTWHSKSNTELWNGTERGQ